jgi:hypothetical protein
MRRRRVLAGAGVLGAAGALGVASTLVGTIDVRWWSTRRAARHSGLRERVESYLERAFEGLRLSVDLSHGGVASFGTEDAHRLVVGGAWPRRLLGGSAVTPVDGVNLLVTDGSMRRAPTGAGLPYVAAVGGAHQMVRAPPVAETDRVVPDRPSLRTLQILVHECGHALGLRHDHGSIREAGPAAVVSPMVSGYAWSSGPVGSGGFDFTENRCGEPYPSVAGKTPRLLLRFDDCERRALHRFRRSGLSVPSPAELSAAELLDAAPVRWGCGGGSQ